MKKISTLVFSFALLCSLSLFAQDTSSQNAPADKKVEKAEKKEAKAASKGKSVRLTGWVKTQDGKTVFVNDKDKQTWTVENPDILNGHDGHHVRVKAKINEADKSLNILSVSMMSKRKQAAKM
jgi:hypothetical protein